MADFTRLTVVRADHRADLVVAADQPLAALLPRISAVLGLPAAAGPFTLVRPLGESLDLEADCGANGLTDGEILHLVDWSDTPASPVVSDVTETVAGLRAGLRSAWDTASQRRVAVGVVGVAALVAGIVAPWGHLSQLARTVTQLGVLAALLAGTVLVGRLTQSWLARPLLTAAVGWSLPGAVALAGLLRTGDVWQVRVFVLALLVWIVIGVGAVGLSHAGAVAGAVANAVVAAIGLVLATSGVSTAGTWGVVGVLAVVIVGIAPTWALSVSGLTGLDDFAATGEAPRRPRVVSGTEDAYAMVAWTVAGLVLLTGVAASLLGAMRADPWALALAIVLLVVLALRTRSLPLAVPMSVLWAVVALAVIAILFARVSGWWLPGALVALIVLSVAVVVIRLPAHIQARLRGLAGFGGRLATLAALPILLGLFGVYRYLLGAFS